MKIRDTPEEMEKEIESESLEYRVVEFTHGSVRFDIPMSQIIKLNIEENKEAAEMFFFREVPRWYFWFPRFIQDRILRYFDMYIGILYDVDKR